MSSGFPITDGVRTPLPAPKGYQVDFAHPTQWKATDHYIVFSLGASFALVALTQRFYTKIYLSKGLQLDDFFMLLAWLTSIGTQSISLWLNVTKAAGVHGWEMTLETFQRFSVGEYASAPVYQLCNGFTKLSLLTFFLHLSPQPWFRTSVWAAIALVATYTPIITFMLIFPCRPVSKSWDIFFPPDEGTCLKTPSLYIATGVSNIVSDLICFLLPIRMVLELQMKPVQKAGALFLFTIASMTVITSIVRLFYLFPLLTSTDPSWDAQAPSIWVFVEANLFIICGSMPTLRRFFRHVAPRFMSMTGSRASQYVKDTVGSPISPTFPNIPGRPRSRSIGSMPVSPRHIPNLYDMFNVDDSELRTMTVVEEESRTESRDGATESEGRGGEEDRVEKGTRNIRNLTVRLE